MKRSRAVHLLYLGIAATALQGCDGEDTRPRAYVEPPTVEVAQGEGAYFSMQECLTRYDQALCTDAFASARGEHLENAPKFATKESCESFAGPGMCETPEAAAASTGAETAAASPAQTASSGGSVFMPMMMGFMVGQAIGNLSGAGRGYYAGPPAGCDRYRLNAAPGTQCAPPARSAGGGGSAYVGAAYSTNRAGRDAPFMPSAAQAAARIPVGAIADSRVAGATPGAVRAPGTTRVPASTRPATTRAPVSTPAASQGTTTRGGFGGTGRSQSGSISSGS